MRGGRTLIGVLLTVALAAGCGGGSEPKSTPTPTPAALTSAVVNELPLGRDDLQLDPGRYRSPLGFAPTIEVTLPSGWRSVHREGDAFDLGRDDPQTDAPLVGVVFITPPEGAADAALAAIRQRANGRVSSVNVEVAGKATSGLDIEGGQGSLIKSAADSIELDASAQQRMRVFALDVDGAPLLVVAVVPPGDRWSELWPDARAVIGTIRLA